MTRTTFDARLDLIPAEPGVYLMKDAAGSVIYVGKAKILPNRLRSYFCKEPQGNKKVLAMIAQIADFSYITCENELEALILENNLIKQYRPHYNILLRDDKEYPYIKVTLHEQYPRVMKVFHVDEDQKKGAVFYGPYLAGDLNLALQALHKIFPIKTCKRVFPRDIGKDRPCLNYYIGRCIGPCLGEVSEAEYRSLIQDICRFLEGNYRGLLTQIESEMKLAADQLNFEAAAQWRDRLTALQHLMARQIIVSQSSESIDVIGLARNASEICLQKLEVREGRMLASSSIFVEDRGEHEGEVLDAYIRQIYREDSYIPLSLIHI